MRDLTTMLWKEVAELFGNRRTLRVFLIAVLAMGLLPELGALRGKATPLALWIDLLYAVFAGMITVAQTAPDLVLRERTGRTLEYLLATRLADSAIFGGKILLSALLGYMSSLLAVCVQLVVMNVTGHHTEWTWAYLAEPQGRLIAFALPAVLVLYEATVGTFVALRVGDQRTAYLMTVLGMGILLLPLLLHVVHPHATMAWLWQAVGIVALVDAVLVTIGLRLFRRESLVLYLQE